VLPAHSVSGVLIAALLALPSDLPPPLPVPFRIQSEPLSQDLSFYPAQESGFSVRAGFESIIPPDFSGSLLQRKLQSGSKT
jgi:hypothetical protein